MSAAHTAALKALGSMLSSESGRAILNEHRPRPDTPVVATDSEEMLGTVLLRSMQYPPPVVLAIHFRPSSDGADSIGAVGLLVLSADAAAVTPSAKDAPSLNVNTNAPVGMLFEAVTNEGIALTVNLSWGQTVTKRSGSLFQAELV